MATFTIAPSFGPTSQRKPRMLAVKFGDGYEQRGLDGIHADLQTWQLTFDPIPVADADTIEAFFVTNQTATIPFIWTAPRAAAASNYICRQWSRTVAGPQHDKVSAMFEEVADL